MRISRRELALIASPALLPGAVAVMTAVPGLVAVAQPPAQCEAGRQVLYYGGNPGQIEGGSGPSCLVRSEDGRTHTWISLKQLSAAPAGKSAVGLSVQGGPSPPSSGAVAVFRPTILNQLVFPADALGHVGLTIKVNDAPVRFLVDTGATLVSLTATDAASAGIMHSDLTFNHTVQTSNGPTQAAFVQLREMRVGQLAIDNVPAAVIDNLKQSVLGMSFLERLKGFEMHNGALTMSW